MELRADFTYTEKELRELISAVMFKKGSPAAGLALRWALVLFDLAMSVVIMLFGNASFGKLLLVVSLGLLFVIVIATLNYWVIPTYSLKKMKKKGEFSIHVTLRENNFQVIFEQNGLNQTTECEYTHLVKIMETNDHFLLYNTKRTAYVIPKEKLIGGTAAELELMIKAHPVPYIKRNI